MNPMTCRIYGRFVMVECGDADSKTLTFLMPNMRFGGSGLRAHHAVMTIARHFVDHRQTTLAPTLRTMTDGGPAQRAEYFIWDLAGWEVDLGAKGGVALTVEDGKEIVDLAELEHIQKRKATLRADLQPATDAIVSASIFVGGGRARASAAFHTPPCAFIALSDAKHSIPERRRDPKFQTDIIDITLPAATVHQVSLKRRDETKHITLNENTSPAVGFSNLCSELPHVVDVDHEFAQYYRLLENVGEDRLVPKVVPSGGDEDCNRQAKICC